MEPAPRGYSSSEADVGLASLSSRIIPLALPAYSARRLQASLTARSQRHSQCRRYRKKAQELASAVLTFLSLAEHSKMDALCPSGCEPSLESVSPRRRRTILSVRSLHRGLKSSIMTESVMFFGIGFFVAALLSLLIFLRVHRRARRLSSTDQFHDDVRQLEEQLAVALQERAKLQSELAATKRDAELSWATERIESALFRERINDVAYEVVRMTQAFESAAPSTEAMSAYSALSIGRERRTGTLDFNGESGVGVRAIASGAITDRVRALRTVASRAVSN
jgi:hypothetical protein